MPSKTLPLFSATSLFSLTLATLLLAGGCTPPEEKAASHARAHPHHRSGKKKPAVPLDIKPEMLENLSPDYKPHYSKKQLRTLEGCLKAAKEANDKVAYQDAYRFVLKALKIDPQCGEAHFLRGKIIFNSAFGDEDTALAEMKRAEELGFRSGELYLYEARIYDGKRDYRQAIASLSRAIEEAPTDMELYKFRAGLYRQMGDEKSAEADYSRRVKLRQTNRSEGYMTRGRYYESRERWQDALKDYDTAVNTDDTETDELRARVRMLLKLKKTEPALKDLDEIIRRNPTDDDSIRLRGELLASRGKFAKALEDYDRVIETSRDMDSETYDARAALYEKMGKPELAAKDRKHAEKIRAQPAEKPIY